MIVVTPSPQPLVVTSILKQSKRLGSEDKVYIRLKAGMDLARRCHEQSMKGCIISESKAPRLSLAIQLKQVVKFSLADLLLKTLSKVSHGREINVKFN